MMKPSQIPPVVGGLVVYLALAVLADLVVYGFYMGKPGSEVVALVEARFLATMFKVMAGIVTLAIVAAMIKEPASDTVDNTKSSESSADEQPLKEAA